MRFSKSSAITDFLLLPRTGESLLNCPKMPGQLGSSVLLPLASRGISKSVNKSVHVLVTRAESPGNSVKKKIVSLDLPEGGSPRYLENGYTFHLENLSLGILESKKENEGWYFMTLEENFSVRHFCLQLKLYGNIGASAVCTGRGAPEIIPYLRFGHLSEARVSKVGCNLKDHLVQGL